MNGLLSSLMNQRTFGRPCGCAPARAGLPTAAAAATPALPARNARLDCPIVSVSLLAYPTLASISMDLVRQQCAQLVEELLVLGLGADRDAQRAGAAERRPRADEHAALGERG